MKRALLSFVAVLLACLFVLGGCSTTPASVSGGATPTPMPEKKQPPSALTSMASSPSILPEVASTVSASITPTPTLTPKPSATPTLAAGSGKYRVEIDLTNQIVTAFNAGTDQVVKRMICSAGTGNTTPMGTFKLAGDRYRWMYFTKYVCWAQYSVRIKGPILFHSVIYSKKDTKTLRVGSVRSLGSPASHGCIRLQVPDAKWIYDNCASGTEVKVFRGKKNSALRKSLLPNLNAPYNRPDGKPAPDTTPTPKPKPTATVTPKPTVIVTPTPTPTPTPTATPSPTSSEVPVSPMVTEP